VTVRTRSLVSNSVASLLSSGLLIFSTLLVPALLVRTISRADYDLLTSVLAMLMLLSVLSSSARGVAPSQLALAYARVDQGLATRAYARFTLMVIAGTALISVIGSELYIWFINADWGHIKLFRFGMYCIVGHALGLLAMGVFAGPAAAQRDFLPDSFAKLWPGIYHLSGIAAIWLIDPSRPLVWIFLVYLTSSWVGAGVLGLRLWQPLFGPAHKNEPKARRALERVFWAGLRGMAWWNLMSYLAVNAATLIVLFLFAREIVPFSIATSFLGIISAGLIAVASPITGYAAGLVDSPIEDRRRFFLLVNSLFQLYILLTSLFILLIPKQIFVLWLTPVLAPQVQHFCFLLLPAYALRQLTVNFTIFVMSVGRQQNVWLTPLLEAALAIGGSVVLGLIIGIEGIAIALAVSSLARLILTVCYDGPRNADAIGLRRGDALWSALTLLGIRR
jgi:hypothetical protein